MENTIKYLWLGLLLLAGNIAFAQNPLTSSLQWETDEFQDAAGVTIHRTTTIVTNPVGNELKWIQKNGSKIYRYTITSKEGTWEDVTADGSLTLNLTGSGQTGTAFLQRASGATTILLKLKAGDDNLQFSFLIDTVNPSEE